MKNSYNEDFLFSYLFVFNFCMFVANSTNDFLQFYKIVIYVPFMKYVYYFFVLLYMKFANKENTSCFFWNKIFKNSTSVAQFCSCRSTRNAFYKKNLKNEKYILREMYSTKIHFKSIQFKICLINKHWCSQFLLFVFSNLID